MPNIAKTVFDHLGRDPTEQEVFDHVVAHLKQMTHRSSSAVGDCVYLSSSGNKCAVGCLLDDPEAAAEWDSRTGNSSILAIVSSVTEDGLHKLSYHPPEWMRSDSMCDLLNRLQRAHDYKLHWNSPGFVQWQKLSPIAKDHRLVFEMPEAI